jgi:hypothetical protein
MIRYANRNGNSAISEYEAGPDFIKVRYGRGPIYVYDYGRPGSVHVEAMKRLASAGSGLATYISQNIKKNFARRE